MQTVANRTLETCSYIYRRVNNLIEILLVNRTTGHNAHKWVPLGCPFDETVSSFQRAVDDLRQAGLEGDPAFRGIATETCIDGRWQYVLLIYATEAPVSWLPAEQAGLSMQWHSLESVPELDTPQADRHFDLAKITSRSAGIFETTMFFSADGVLQEVVRHDRSDESREA